jgi:hypothetical protein
MAIPVFGVVGVNTSDLHPKIPAHVVFRPTFLTRDFSHTIGTGFLIEGKSSDSSFLVTVHHVFGPDGGLESELTGAHVPAVFPRAVGFSFDKDPMLLTTDEGVPVFDARKADDNGAERDIALFRVRGWSAGKTLKFARKRPELNQEAWIVLRDPVENEMVFAKVVLAWMSETEFRYLIPDPHLNYTGASGAPVIDKNGDVIAMHVGFFTSKSGRRFGFGCPASAIWEVLPKE